MKSNAKIILITSVVTSIIVGSSVGVGTWFGLSNLRTETTDSPSTTKSTSSLKDRSIEWVNEFENTFVNYLGELQSQLINGKTLKPLNEKYQVYCEDTGRIQPFPGTSDTVERTIQFWKNRLRDKIKWNELTGTLGSGWVSFALKGEAWICFEYTGTTTPTTGTTTPTTGTTTPTTGTTTPTTGTTTPTTGTTTPTTGTTTPTTEQEKVPTYKAILPNGQVLEKSKDELLANGLDYENKNYKATEENGKIYVTIDETTVDFGTPTVALPAFNNHLELNGPNKDTDYVFNIKYAGIGNVIIKNDGKIWRTSNVVDGAEPTESVNIDENGMAYIPLDWVGTGATDDTKVVPFTFFNLGESEATAEIRLATNNAATSLDTIGTHGDRGTANFISKWPGGWGDEDIKPKSATARTANIDFKIRELKTKDTAGQFVDATVTLPSTTTQAHGYKYDYKAKDLYYPVQMTAGGEGSLLFHGTVKASFDGKLKYDGEEFQVPDKSSVATARDIRVEITSSVVNDYGTAGTKRGTKELFINVESGWLDYFKEISEKWSVKDLARRLGIKIRFKVGSADDERNFISTVGVNDLRASEVFFLPGDATSQFTTGNKLAPLKYTLKEELEKTSAYSDSLRAESRIIEGKEKGSLALFPFNSEADFIAYNKDIFPDGLDFSSTSFPDYLGDTDYGALATVQTASTTANTESVKKKILASNHLIISGATWANDFYDAKMEGQVSTNQQDIAWQKNPNSKFGDADYGEFYSVFADTAGMAASPKFQAWVDHYKNANAAFKGGDANSLYAKSALFNGHVGAIIAGPWWIDGSWKSGSYRATGTASEKKEFAENKIGYQALPAGHSPLDGGWYAGMVSTISDEKQQVAEAFIYEMTRPSNANAFSNGLSKFSSRLDTSASSADKINGEVSAVIASSEKTTKENFANTDWVWGPFSEAAAAITSTSTYASVAADIKKRAEASTAVTKLLLPVVATS